MPVKPTQSYANHARIDPKFHYFVAPVAAATFVFAVYSAIRRFSFATAWIAVLALAFLIAVFTIRIYSLKVQDRVIRLEERLRLERVLNEPLRSRIPELTVGQLVALRFAPDEELPGLVEHALTDGWGNKDIKKSIQNWRPDNFRL